MSLAGKVIAVVGGSTGIGATAARNFAKAGASIVLADLNPDKGKAVVEAIRSVDGGKAVFVHCDVRRQADVDAFVKAAVKEYGRLDGAFNNVGISPENVPLNMLEPETMASIIDVNLAGILRLMQAEVKQMLAQGPGSYSIVNMSSVGGIQPLPVITTYAATKAGVIAASNATAAAFGAAGIRVNCVAPTGVNGTEMSDGFREQLPELAAKMEKQHPLQRFATTEDVANTVEFLLSEKASYISAQTIAVDGGLLNSNL